MMNDTEFKKFLVDCMNWIERRYDALLPDIDMWKIINDMSDQNLVVFTKEQRDIFRRLYNVARSREWYVRDRANAFCRSTATLVWFSFCKNPGETMRLTFRSKKRRNRQYSRANF